MTDYKQDYNNGQIHGWNGGDCPVHPETMVEAWFRGGGSSETVANRLFWSRSDKDGDIIAFQVVKPYVEPERTASLKVIWVNEYADGQYGAHNTKEKAERNASGDLATRIAVKYVEVKE